MYPVLFTCYKGNARFTWKELFRRNNTGRYIPAETIKKNSGNNNFKKCILQRNGNFFAKESEYCHHWTVSKSREKRNERRSFDGCSSVALYSASRRVAYYTSKSKKETLELPITKVVIEQCERDHEMARDKLAVSYSRACVVFIVFCKLLAALQWAIIILQSTP